MASRARRRRRLSLTSLIDVIFLLLLFFMLSSTFSKFSEIELSASAGGAGVTPEARPLFLQLLPDDLRLNGRSVALDGLGDAIGASGPDARPRPLLVSLKGEVTAQRLTDLLAALRKIENIAPTILGGASP